VLNEDLASIVLDMFLFCSTVKSESAGAANHGASAGTSTTFTEAPSSLRHSLEDGKSNEWCTFARLLAHTAAEAGTREVIRSHVAAQDNTTVAEAATRMNISETQVGSADNFVIFRWVEAIMSLDASQPSLPLYCQVMACLFFEHVMDGSQRPKYMGHRFLSEVAPNNVTSALVARLDCAAGEATASGRTVVAELLSIVRMWVSTGTTDVACGVLVDKCGLEGGGVSADLLYSVLREKPWTNPGILWLDYVDCDAVRAHLDDQLASMDWRPTQLIQRQPLGSDIGDSKYFVGIPKMFSVVQPAPLPPQRRDLSKSLPWPLHDPAQLLINVSNDIENLEAAAALHAEQCNEAMSLDAVAEELMPRLYQNSQREAYVEQKCSAWRKTCTGPQRFQAVVNKVTKHEHAWTQLAGNRRRWRRHLQRFDVEGAWVTAVLRARRTTAYPQSNLSAELRATGTDTLLQVVLPKLIGTTQGRTFAPAREMLTVAVPILMTAYVRDDPAQMLRLLQVLVKNPLFIPFVSDYFDPFVCFEGGECNHTLFVDMYSLVLEGSVAKSNCKISASAMLELLQVFDVESWLMFQPDEATRCKFIRVCSRSLFDWCSTVSIDDLPAVLGERSLEEVSIFEGQYNALLLTMAHQWPAHFMLLLSEILEGRLLDLAAHLANEPLLDCSALDKAEVEQAAIMCRANFGKHEQRQLFEDAYEVKLLEVMTLWFSKMLSQPDDEGNKDAAWALRVTQTLFRPWLWKADRLGMSNDGLWDTQNSVANASASAVLRMWVGTVGTLCTFSPKLCLRHVWKWYHENVVTIGRETNTAQTLLVVHHALDELPWSAFPPPGAGGGGLLPSILVTMGDGAQQLDDPPISSAAAAACSEFYARVISSVDWPRQLFARRPCASADLAELLAVLLTLLRDHPLPLSDGLLQACSTCALCTSAWYGLQPTELADAIRRFPPIPRHTMMADQEHAGVARGERARFDTAMGLVRAASVADKPTAAGASMWLHRARVYIEYRFEPYHGPHGHGHGAGGAVTAVDSLHCTHYLTQAIDDALPHVVRQLLQTLDAEHGLRLAGEFFQLVVTMCRQVSTPLVSRERLHAAVARAIPQQVRRPLRPFWRPF
jgi:hypothetical protein